jgi:hypothetical protein
MHPNTLFFEFQDPESLAQALGVLCQTGHHAHAALRIEAGMSDLASALEIAQAFGGKSFDPEEAMQEAEVFSAAYSLGGIVIPAHVVAEDWPDDYLAAEANAHDRVSH